MTEVISWIETEKQTDCRVVPPRNDATESHYEERVTKDVVILWRETEKSTDCRVVTPRNDATDRHYEERGTKDVVISWIETEKQTDCRVVPPRNDATESHYEERGTKDVSSRHCEGSMTEVISWLKLKTNRLPRRASSQWRIRKSLRGKYDRSNLMN
jgi:hypothetical protein